MKFRFWGVRGSIPTPISPSQIQSRISAVVQRISPKDLVSPDTREKFIASLPEWIFGTTGGNTACVEVETNDGETIIFDAGTGIRELAIDIMKRPEYKKKNVYHLFLTHFHWDHIQGLPFMNLGFDPKNKIIIYSTRKKCRELLEKQMTYPYFPVSMTGKKGFKAKFEFRHIPSTEIYVRVGSAKIGWHKVRHPDGCTSYSVTDGGKKFIFSTDTELRPQDFEKNPRNTEYYTNADALVIDAQYTLSDAIEKEGWGHSSFSTAIDFASSWNIKRVYLFHHEPTYSDKKIHSIKQSAEWYAGYAGTNNLEILLAKEGLEVIL